MLPNCVSWTVCSTLLSSYAPHSLYLLRNAVMLQLLVYYASYWMKHVVSICRGFVHHFCLRFHCRGDQHFTTLFAGEFHYNYPPWTCFVGVFLDVLLRFGIAQNWMTFALLFIRVGLSLQVACNILFVMYSFYD